MWNTKASNKIIDKIHKYEVQCKHMHRLKTIKPMIDNKTPKKYSFLQIKAKANRLKEGKVLQDHRAAIKNRL